MFFIGFIMNVFFRFSWLFVPGLILVLIGIFVRVCLYIGLALIVIDVAVSLVEQIIIRRAFLKDSDNPEFSEFQDALSGDGNWRDNVTELLNQKISNSENEITLDENNQNQ